jgi:hypothetical protein
MFQYVVWMDVWMDVWMVVWMGEVGREDRGKCISGRYADILPVLRLEIDPQIDPGFEKSERIREFPAGVPH